jgi:long-chain fatty acid transport protein
MKIRTFVHAAVLPLVFLPGMALATSGYFATGYGVKSAGMGGVGIALPQDGLAAATNPAGTAFVGDRVDLGLTWFMPNRHAEITGSMMPGLNGDYNGNDTRHFFIPELGYVKQFSPQLSGGVAIYGNGGMNSDYANNPLAAFGGTGNAGVDLSQLFISPSLAYKITPDHSIGIAVNIAYQRFKAEGIPALFGMFSESPTNMSDNGYDSAWGWGGRIGYTGKITPELTIGATYATKTYMGSFDKYKGLFAEQGGFDIPANFGVGVAWKATPELTLAADYMRIQYSGVKSISNPIDNLFPITQFGPANTFGSNNGPGFGWEDVDVFKLGAAYQMGDWTLRGGYTYASQPIPESQTFLNIYAPGVVQHHLSLGATWATSKTGELSFSYVHAFENTVNGSGSIPPAFGGGETNLTMFQDSFGVAYGWKF